MSGAMQAQRTYGPDLAANFGGRDGPFVLTRSLRGAEVAVTELRVDKPLGRLSDPLPCEDAYMVSVMLRELPANAYWEGGRQVSQFSLVAGETTLHDLKREPLAVMDKPVHSLLWYIPRITFDALAEHTNVPYISELRYSPGVAVADETIRDISLLMLPALRTPEQTNRLFADYVTLAFAAHVAHTYGGMRAAPRLMKGGLAPWQERRSKEILAGDLAGGVSLSEVAEACGLSVSHFARAFRRSTGVAPHAWLLQARVERSMTLLRQTQFPLSAIAQACGFADQSHFTRVFTRQVGASPAAWRRIVRN